MYTHQLPLVDFVILLNYCSSSRPSYLINLLSLRLVGMLGAKINVSSSY